MYINSVSKTKQLSNRINRKITVYHMRLVTQNKKIRGEEITKWEKVLVLFVY